MPGPVVSLNRYYRFKCMPLQDIPPSPPLEIVSQVRKKVAAGEKIYSLAIGEPVHDTPQEIIDAASEAMKKGMTHYVSSFGIPEVRAAISRKAARKNGISCSEDNTIFMASKMAIYAIYMALNTGSGGEILVPDPGYFFSEPAVLAGLTPVSYHLKGDYSLDLEDIGARITGNTKAIVVNTPSNPTGKMYSQAELKALFDLCVPHGIRIISDEAYEDLTYGKKHISMGSMEPSPSSVISLFTLSKSYSMTGWRAGYVIADPAFIGLLAKYMDHAATCFPPFIQHASAVALDTLDWKVEEFRKDFSRKRDYVVKRLAEIPGIHPNEAEGAFYMFPGYDADSSSLDIARGLLNDCSVAVLPGSAFGSRGEKHLRISYSGSMETLEEGMARMEKFFRKL